MTAWVTILVSLCIFMLDNVPFSVTMARLRIFGIIFSKLPVFTCMKELGNIANQVWHYQWKNKNKLHALMCKNNSCTPT